MKDFVIYPKDYVNLNETLSEKNIINKVIGKEYLVTEISGTEIDRREINPNTLEKLFNGEPYKYSNSKDLSPNINLYNNISFEETHANSYISDLFGLIKRNKARARTESLFLFDSYNITSTEVITDTNSVSCEFAISCTKSKVNEINEQTYNIPFRSSVFVNNVFPMEEEEIVFDTPIEVENGKATSSSLAMGLDTIFTSVYSDTANAISKVEGCNIKLKNQTDYGTTFNVDYLFKIWGAWVNQETNDFNSSISGNAICANNIEIVIKANTVDTNESSFSYRDKLATNERQYELETNELFQTTLEEPETEKLSYKTYKKIVDAFSTDRRIITFDLLNPIKVQIDDTKRYEKGEKEERYIDTDDEFSIYDEHNNYIGDFKVIQSNPIWDGSYHKIITAMLIE